MQWLLPPVVLWGCLTACVTAEPQIEGTTAPRWSPCTGWTTTPATAYSVTNEDGSLVFSAQGANREMPWIIDLDQVGLSGDERYLLVRYRAHGLSTNPAVYFLHGEEGTRGGMTYAMADDLKPDAQWHVLAVDLLAIDPLEVTHQLALKVCVDAGGSARLEISKLWFANDLPAETQLARQPSERPQEFVKLEWATSKPLPREGWTTTPATDFFATHSDNEMTFHVRGPDQGHALAGRPPRARGPGEDAVRLRAVQGGGCCCRQRLHSLAGESGERRGRQCGHRSPGFRLEN